MYYPVFAKEFVKQTNLQGNMFNEYGFGGYLLYYLYPQQKVFYDGRTDIYLCCEIPETLELARQKHLPDDKYRKVIDELFDKHKISYAIFKTEKSSLSRKISRVLNNDPTWSLVFWDDYSQIFVKRDGKNSQIIDEYGAKYATPYNKNPYLLGKEKEALVEYQKMLNIVDSAKTRNSIGYIYLKQGKIDEAAKQFVIAANKDKTDESPLMNLAEIAAYKKDVPTAIEFYSKAKSIAPDRGLIYIRLGQLILLQTRDIQKAKDIWLEGINNTLDTNTKRQLEKLYSNS